MTTRLHTAATLVTLAVFTACVEPPPSEVFPPSELAAGLSLQDEDGPVVGQVTLSSERTDACPIATEEELELSGLERTGFRGGGGKIFWSMFGPCNDIGADVRRERADGQELAVALDNEQGRGALRFALPAGVPPPEVTSVSPRELRRGDPVQVTFGSDVEGLALRSVGLQMKRGGTSTTRTLNPATEEDEEEALELQGSVARFNFPGAVEGQNEMILLLRFETEAECDGFLSCGASFTAERSAGMITSLD